MGYSSLHPIYLLESCTSRLDNVEYSIKYEPDKTGLFQINWEEFNFEFEYLELVAEVDTEKNLCSSGIYFFY